MGYAGDAIDPKGKLGVESRAEAVLKLLAPAA